MAIASRCGTAMTTRVTTGEGKAAVFVVAAHFNASELALMSLWFTLLDVVPSRRRFTRRGHIPTVALATVAFCS